jgi:predicted ATPase
VADAFPDGVYFVPLATVTTEDVMWTTISGVLDYLPKDASTRVLPAHRAPFSAVVLDNLEQLPAADHVVSALIEAAPQIVVLATSRRPLLLTGEWDHAVPPLELPAEASLPAVEASGAVQMFVQHASMRRRLSG